MKTISSPRFCIAILSGTAFLFAGCSKKADNTMNYTRAINDYYNAHPLCLWREPVKFPVQVNTSDTSKTAPYDALVDQGLLARTTDEKTKLLVINKQVTNYDLSDKGRSTWTADPQQPGYGNFCYGHKTVKGIDSATPASSDEGATTQVNYHTTIADAPAWVNAPETQNAYPEVHAALAGSQPAQAILINTNSGWKVGRIQPRQS